MLCTEGTQKTRIKVNKQWLIVQNRKQDGNVELLAPVTPSLYNGDRPRLKTGQQSSESLIKSQGSHQSVLEEPIRPRFILGDSCLCDYFCIKRFIFL